ncbi:MAG: hypothetical protein B6U72_02985 [Candidatus Altiarchaeales archaeon ex4484_2]|nr:MAG: hypothetical protein B6U72_02985 [Candidatus Altiarchaeales archaeon ex4484_2]
MMAKEKMKWDNSNLGTKPKLRNGVWVYGREGTAAVVHYLKYNSIYRILKSKLIIVLDKKRFNEV